MKKRQVFLAAFAATMLIPAVAWAQYPQITEEAKANYTKMMTEERKRSDEAGQKPCRLYRKKPRKDARIPLGLAAPAICRKPTSHHFPERKAEECTVSVVVAEK